MTEYNRQTENISIHLVVDADIPNRQRLHNFVNFSFWPVEQRRALLTIADHCNVRSISDPSTWRPMLATHWSHILTHLLLGFFFFFFFRRRGIVFLDFMPRTTDSRTPTNTVCRLNEGTSFLVWLAGSFVSVLLFVCFSNLLMVIFRETSPEDNSIVNTCQSFFSLSLCSS